MHTVKPTRAAGAAPFRNLIIKTPRGNVRLAIYTESHTNASPRGGPDGKPPEDITATLKSFLQSDDPITKKPLCRAEWMDAPTEPGFYVRWRAGDGLSEVYHGGPDTPEEYIKPGKGVQFFGPFELPI
jgi:hypothetical protein